MITFSSTLSSQNGSLSAAFSREVASAKEQSGVISIGLTNTSQAISSLTVGGILLWNVTPYSVTTKNGYIDVGWADSVYQFRLYTGEANPFIPIPNLANPTLHAVASVSGAWLRYCVYATRADV